jgi:sialate O-acetylesterase
MKRVCIIWLLLVQLIIAEKSSGQIVLPQILRDSMVLQRNATINVWGWASKGEKVTIAFNKKNFKATTGTGGKWKIALPAMRAGGPYTMVITGKNKITLNNILIGDVWFCSGQSNMVHQLNIHDVRYADEIAHANFPEIRQFLIPTLNSLQGPKENLPTGFWNAAVGEAVRPFSAVAYFFAKQLYQRYHVPIGIINASVGGTTIEAWTSEEGLKNFPELTSVIQKNKDTGYVNQQAKLALAVNARQNTGVPDKGLTGPLPWYDLNYIPQGWQTIAVPGYWEDQGISNLDGIVWYRKEIDVPASMVGKPAKVFLGRIVDADVLYINGQQVGATTYMYPQRRYTMPSTVLKAGKNVVVVKVTNNAGKGGFVSGKPYCLFAGNDTIDLKGYWQYKVGAVFLPKKTGVGNVAFSAQNQPAALFNAMVAPITNYTIKGFVWYQGESNTGNARGYAKLQPAQIADWRNKWGQGDLPFLWVQLPNFMDASYLPSESQWAELREAQLNSLSVPNTGMAVAIDLGEWNDIHPDNKKEVGDRLALVAEKIAYGENIVYSGPLLQSAAIEGNRITLSFTNTGSGLVTNDGEPPGEFAIAGADKKFVWANATITGDKIVVWNDAITAPLYVRYAWADNPVNPNLYNKETRPDGSVGRGLPASPFRTDQ